MSATKLINVLIHEILAGSASNLSVYADSAYSKKLRLAMIEHIQFILYKIKKDQFASEISDSSFNLSERINYRHPETGFTVLDYCLLSGLCEMAVAFAFCGATTKYVDIMHHKIDQYFTGSTGPEIIADIIATIEELELIKRSISQINSQTANDIGWLKRGTTFIHDNKTPAFLFTLGLSCTILSPIIHGAGTILLLSIGIPSLLSSVGAYQNSRGGKDNRIFTQSQAQIDHQVKEIDGLLAMVAQEKHMIISKSPKINAQIVDLTKKPKGIELQAAENLLFNFDNPLNQVNNIEKTVIAQMRNMA